MTVISGPKPVPATVPSTTPAAPRPTAPRRRPAVYIAASLAVGVVIGLRAPFLPLPLAVTAVGLALVALTLTVATARFRYLPPILLGLALILAGMARVQLTTSLPPTSPLHILGDEPRLVRAHLRITEPPVLRTAGIRETIATRADFLAIEHDGDWQPATGRLLLRFPAAGDPSLAPGDEVHAIGELARIASPSNPGEYNWQRHFARESIHLRLAVNQPGAISLARAGDGSLLWSARQAVRSAFAAGMPHDERRALLQALLLGDNDELLEQAWSDFRASGTAHHLSISGMHIAALAGFVALIGRCLMLHPRNVLLLAVGFAIVYAALTRPSPPVIRSVLLCTALASSILFRRNTDAVQCLCVAVVAMLLYNPLDLFNPGFQLSFSAVAALMLLTTRVSNWFTTLEHEHERMARLIVPPAGVRAAWHWFRTTIIAMLSASLVAHAISLPLIAIHFGQINPWAVPASILMAPVVSVALVVALLKMVLSLLIPPAAPILGIPAIWLAGIMRESVGLLARLPGAELTLPEVPVWLVLPYLALALLPALAFARSRWWALSPALAVLVLAGGATLAARSPNHLQITLLSVGNGGCALVTTPDGKQVMIDCGAARGNDLFSRTIEPYLRWRGIRRLDALLITHDDYDHRSALPEVSGRYAPRVYLPLFQGSLPELSGDVTWDVLAPPPHTTLVGNDASAVIRIRYAGKTILFTGDVEQAGIEALLRSGAALKSDILIAPHHGAIEEASPALLAWTQPDWILCSSGPRLWGTQKRFDAIVPRDRLIRTGDSGAITVTIAPDGSTRVDTFRRRNAP